MRVIRPSPAVRSRSVFGARSDEDDPALRVIHRDGLQSDIGKEREPRLLPEEALDVQVVPDPDAAVGVAGQDGVVDLVRGVERIGIGRPLEVPEGGSGPTIGQGRSVDGMPCFRRRIRA